jgi:O-antigen/teichoic acid export membrane protein
LPSFKDRLMSLNLRKTSGNALSILSSDVMNRVTSFVLYAMVARHLGAQEFGQLSLALTLFYTFQVFAVGGLKTLIVRQVAKDRAQTRLYFLNGLMIVTFTSVASLVALWSFVHVMRYPASTTRVILLLSLGLVPYTISAVCEGLFQAWERMPYIAFVNVPVNIAKVVGAYVLLATNRGLYPVVLVLLASLAAIAGFEIWNACHHEQLEYHPSVEARYRDASRPLQRRHPIIGSSASGLSELGAEHISGNVPQS